MLGTRLATGGAGSAGSASARWRPCNGAGRICFTAVNIRLNTGMGTPSAVKSERAVYPEGSRGRVENYLAALIEALRMRGITALFTKEIHQVVAPELDFADNPISVMAENVLLLRKVEYEGGLHHVLSVIKMRFSAHDASTVREFTIAIPDGIRVLAPQESGRTVLGDIAKQEGERGSGTVPGTRGGEPHGGHGRRESTRTSGEGGSSAGNTPEDLP